MCTAINQKIVIAAFEKQKRSWKMKKRFVIFKRIVCNIVIQVHMNSNNNCFCKLSNFAIYEI